MCPRMECKMYTYQWWKAKPAVAVDENSYRADIIKLMGTRNGITTMIRRVALGFRSNDWMTMIKFVKYHDLKEYDTETLKQAVIFYNPETPNITVANSQAIDYRNNRKGGQYRVNPYHVQVEKQTMMQNADAFLNFVNSASSPPEKIRDGRL